MPPVKREFLDKALEANPDDIDVLIACYQLPGQPPEYRAKIVQLDQEGRRGLARDDCRRSRNALGYNNYAWLIGNTEGDMDEAVRYSQKSLELQPESAGFYDTLAHVYAGKGDLAARREVRGPGRENRAPLRTDAPRPGRLPQEARREEEKR